MDWIKIKKSEKEGWSLWESICKIQNLQYSYKSEEND